MPRGKMAAPTHPRGTRGAASYGEAGGALKQNARRCGRSGAMRERAYQYLFAFQMSSGGSQPPEDSQDVEAILEPVA